MRTAPVAWLVAGSLGLSAATAVAGEGSSLRGLKPPRDAFGADAPAATSADGEPGLDWRIVGTRATLAPRLSLYTGTLETRRFVSRNADYSTGVYRPLREIRMGLGAGQVDPIHNAVPKYTLYGQFNQSVGGGWGLGFGLRQSEYNFATSNVLSLSAERYIGNFRGAYTMYTNGNALTSTQRIQVDYFYGDRNTIGLAYTTGRDVDQLGVAGIGLPANDIRDLTLSGRHWLSTNWALTYDVLSQEQSVLSARRQGLRLGVSRSF